MTKTSDLPTVIWHKSSYSGPDNECVEVADGIPGAIPVRDSKNPGGPSLLFSAAAWTAFITAVRKGDLPKTR
ncbi:DUF397 domain-containing protein [Kitasatospora sp. NPDC101183]|uniref:DUF397 domain-containing protein n=1 Tax=Kitasatospora sp. NPDC101183 TaxID=3364100 RepID=UPI003801AABB